MATFQLVQADSLENTIVKEREASLQQADAGSRTMNVHNTNVSFFMQT